MNDNKDTAARAEDLFRLIDLGPEMRASIEAAAAAEGKSVPDYVRGILIARGVIRPDD